jgi:hypothetical protein
VETIELDKLHDRVARYYASINNPIGAFYRDIAQLRSLQAVVLHQSDPNPNPFEWPISINLEWPQQISETEFFLLIKTMPKGKTFKFLS